MNKSSTIIVRYNISILDPTSHLQMNSVDIICDINNNTDTCQASEEPEASESWEIQLDGIVQQLETLLQKADFKWRNQTIQWSWRFIPSSKKVQ